MSSRRSAAAYLLRLELVPLLGVLLFIGIMRGLEAVVGPGLRSVGPLGGAALALVPALIWLAYFFILDRRQPEPTHYVLSVFLLGALVAAPLARWLLHDLLGLSSWASLSVLGSTNLVLTFLCVATAQELSKYLVVRYTVFLSAAFDERADGIVYATAAGIGFATALNQSYATHGFYLTVGAIEITTVALAHACFAGVWGHALGNAKFAARRAQLMQAAGLLAAILLNGGFYVLHSLVSNPDLGVRPWQGLGATALFAAITFAVLNVFMARSQRRDAGEPPVVPPSPRGFIELLRRADALVLLLAAVLLAAGGLVKRRALEGSRPCRLGGLSLRCPRGWLSAPDLAAPGEQLRLDPLSPDPFKPRLTARFSPGARDALSCALLERRLEEVLGPRASLLHTIRCRSLRVAGADAARLDYAYAANPAEPEGSDLPVVVKGSLLALQGAAGLHWVRVEQSAAQHAEQPHLADRLLGSVRP